MTVFTPADATLEPSADTVAVTMHVPPTLAAKLADPAVAASLASLLSHADLVALLVEGLDGLITRAEVIGDALIGGIQELKATVDATDADRAGPSFAELLAAFRTLIDRAPALAELATPELVRQLAVAGRGVEAGTVAFAEDPVQIKGVMSVPKLFKDPDIARAISYLATVAKALGRELTGDRTPPKEG